MTANVETMFSVRETPWHGLGVVVENALKSEEALQAAGLDWEVVPAPVVVNDRVVPRWIANTRSDTGDVLGMVSERYTVVQNREAFAFTDKLISEGNVKFETAGSIKDGRQVWMLARLDEHREVLGDDVTPYLCFTNTHDGTGSVKVLMTPVRVVCQNTLNVAIRGASRKWSTIHMGKLDQKLEEAARTLEMAHKYLDKLEDEAQRLVEMQVSLHDWRDLVAQILPMPKNPGDRTIRTIEEKRESLYQCLFKEDVQKFQGTGWAVVNAVTDFVQHVKPHRLTDTYQENLFHRVVNGDYLLDRATELLLA